MKLISCIILTLIIVSLTYSCEKDSDKFPPGYYQLTTIGQYELSGNMYERNIVNDQLKVHATSDQFISFCRYLGDTDDGEGDYLATSLFEIQKEKITGYYYYYFLGSDNIMYFDNAKIIESPKNNFQIKGTMNYNSTHQNNPWEPIYPVKITGTFTFEKRQ